MPSVDDNETLVRAACYCRISSDPDDRREGVTRQREDTAALCEIKGWRIAGVYVDNDRSASNGKQRPEWERLLADIEAGKIDAVAAWDQDRVNRMMDDFQRYKKIFARHRIKLATSNGGDIDLTTPGGVLTAQIKTAMTEHDIAMMRIRMRRAGRQRAEKGRPSWKRAFGYLPDTRRNGDDDGTRQLDPRTAPLVRDAYAAILAGASLKDVAAMWNDAEAFTVTGKPWQTSTVAQFLRQPRNAGLRSYTDTGAGTIEILGKGTWPPLVGEPLWRAVQAALDTRPSGGRGQRRSMRKHLLTGMLACGACGGSLGGNRNQAGALAYVCTGCRGLTVRAVHVEPLIIEAIGRRLAKEDAEDLLKCEVHDEVEAEKIREAKAALYGELDNIATERGHKLLTGRQAQIASEIVQQQIDALERREEDAERVRVFDGIPLGTPAAGAAVEALTPDRLRAVMRVLIEVAIEPVGRRGNKFDKERVKVKWKV